jgi:signal transduction histidine kinase
MVLADRAKVNMALTNILNNAVNFTPAGGTITIGTAVRNKDEVWISVRDSGIGLEKDQLDQIFEEFYQVEDHMIRKVGGLGIGLCISKAIAEAHGGRIWADSPGLKQGATFTLALPLTT